MLLDVWKWHLLCLRNFFIQFLILSHLPLFVNDFLDVWHMGVLLMIFFLLVWVVPILTGLSSLIVMTSDSE